MFLVVVVVPVVSGGKFSDDSIHKCSPSSACCLSHLPARPPVS